jgi:hypothetical protein
MILRHINPRQMRQIDLLALIFEKEPETTHLVTTNMSRDNLIALAENTPPVKHPQGGSYRGKYRHK